MTAVHDLSLDEFLDGADDDEITAPESREHVDRLLGRLARIRAARERDMDAARLRFAQIDEWLQGRLAIHDSQVEHIEAVLTAWHEHLLSLDDRAKSVSLPNGTLKSRAYGQTVKVTDEMAFLEWATVNAPDLIRERTTTAPDVRGIKGALPIAKGPDGLVVVDPKTGEPVPGIEAIPGGRTFSVDTTSTEEVAS